MKKVTLLLPDEVISVGGTSHWCIKEELPTNHESVLKALTTNDYHLCYYFEEQTVQILSIEDVSDLGEVVTVKSDLGDDDHSERPHK